MPTSRLRLSRLLLALFVLISPNARAEEPRKDPVLSIAAARIVADITFFASDAMNGRNARTADGQRAAEWVAKQFEDAGLKPLPGGDGYFHRLPDVGGGRWQIPQTRPSTQAAGAAPATQASTRPSIPDLSPNVVGVRPGNPDRIVLVTAHYDHLAPARPGSRQARGDDVIFNGADDNASGTCGMIAIARALKDAGELNATIIFIGFSGEELGLRGARQIAGSPPFELGKVVAMFNMDMISRSVDGRDDEICVDGRKEADPLRDAMRRANDRYKLGLDIQFDKHPDWINRSDQGPFVARKVPAVLLSVEDHEDYHQVTDHADKVLPKLVERVTRMVCASVLDFATAK